MSLNLPSSEPDKTLAALMGEEYAADAAMRDRRIAGRDIFERTSINLTNARRELETMERSDAAFANRAVYYRNISRISMRIARATMMLAELHEEYPTEAKSW